MYIYVHMYVLCTYICIVHFFKCTSKCKTNTKKIYLYNLKVHIDCTHLYLILHWVEGYIVYCIIVLSTQQELKLVAI